MIFEIAHMFKPPPAWPIRLSLGQYDQIVSILRLKYYH